MPFTLQGQGVKRRWIDYRKWRKQKNQVVAEQGLLIKSMAI